MVGALALVKYTKDEVAGLVALLVQPEYHVVLGIEGVEHPGHLPLGESVIRKGVLEGGGLEVPGTSPEVPVDLGGDEAVVLNFGTAETVSQGGLKGPSPDEHLTFQSLAAECSKLTRGRRKRRPSAEVVDGAVQSSKRVKRDDHLFVPDAVYRSYQAEWSEAVHDYGLENQADVMRVNKFASLNAVQLRRVSINRVMFSV